MKFLICLVFVTFNIFAQSEGSSNTNHISVNGVDHEDDRNISVEYENRGDADGWISLYLKAGAGINSNSNRNNFVYNTKFGISFLHSVIIAAESSAHYVGNGRVSKSSIGLGLGSFLKQTKSFSGLEYLTYNATYRIGAGKADLIFNDGSSKTVMLSTGSSFVHGYDLELGYENKRIRANGSYKKSFLGDGVSTSRLELELGAVLAKRIYLGLNRELRNITSDHSNDSRWVTQVKLGVPLSVLYQ